jgi:hypothetical protein
MSATGREPAALGQATLAEAPVAEERARFGGATDRTTPLLGRGRDCEPHGYGYGTTEKINMGFSGQFSPTLVRSPYCKQKGYLKWSPF